MDIKRAATSLALGSVMTVGIIGLASPAQAEWTDCPKYYGCAWQDRDFNGGAPNAQFKDRIENYTSSNDNVDSIVNAGSCGSFSRTWFYENSGFKGDNRDLYCPGLAKQSRDPWLANGTDEEPGDFSNRISSSRFENN